MARICKDSDFSGGKKNNITISFGIFDVQDWSKTEWRCPIHGGYPQFSYFRIFHEINHPCVGTPHIHPYPTGPTGPTGPTAHQAASISCVVVGVIASSEIVPQAILAPVESWILGWSKSIELDGTVVVEFTLKTIGKTMGKWWFNGI